MAKRKNSADKSNNKQLFLTNKKAPIEASYNDQMATGYIKRTIFDSNSNIYKNDPKYRMDRYLQFSSPAEEDLFHYQYSKRLQSSIIFMVLAYLYNVIKIKTIDDSVDYCCVIIIYFTIAFSGFFFAFDENYLIYKPKKEKLFRGLFSLSKFSIIIQLTKDNPKLSIYSICFFQISTLFGNMIFDTSADKFIIIYICNFFAIFFSLAYYGKGDEPFILSMVYLFLSMNGIFLMMVTIGLAILNYLIRKGRRELWALYDSFKNSYHNINNCLMNCVSFPLFIMTKKKCINYKNKAADEFCQLFMSSNKPTKGSHDINNFQDVLVNDKLFDYHFANCLSNARIKSSFIYPFITKSNSEKELSKMSISQSNLLSGDLTGMKWYLVMISPCLWKNTECFFMQLIPYEDMYFEEFIEENFYRLTEILSEIIEDFDVCLWKIKEPLSISSEKIRRNTGKKGKMDTTTFYQMSYPLFDYSILFFFQDKCQFLYDLYLTLQVFSWFYTHKISTVKDNIKLDQLVSHLSEYFFIPAQQNNFTIEYNVKGPTNLKISYLYLRIVLINLILFVLNNSKNKAKHKTVNFTIEVQKNAEKDKDKTNDERDYVKICIDYIDPEPVIDFTKLNTMLNDLNLAFVSFECEIKKARCFSFGLLVVNYISNMIYNNAMVMNSENNYHRVTFLAKGKILNQQHDSSLEYIKFYNKEDYSTTQYHFNQILTTVYKSSDELKDYKFFKAEIPAKKLKWALKIKKKEDDDESMFKRASSKTVLDITYADNLDADYKQYAQIDKNFLIHRTNQSGLLSKINKSITLYRNNQNK